MKRILVIDGQGGGMGKAVVEGLLAALSDIHITAAGTNALATAAMLRAGAHAGATGENAIVYNSARVDIIIGPIGIVLADAMLGELTAAMAAAVGKSAAQRILIPVNRCNTVVAGVPPKTSAQLIEDAVEAAAQLIQRQRGPQDD